MTVVSLETATRGAFETTLKILDSLQFRNYAEEKQNVLVKPNLVLAGSATEGLTTDVNVVAAVLHALQDCGVRQVTIGEGSASRTELAYRQNGYYEVAKRYGAELIDLNTAPSVRLSVPNPLSIAELRVAKIAYESDFRISVAKLKIHSLAVVTGCLKNMMGALPGRQWKIAMHLDIHNRLVDLNKLLLPHFGVIDGIVGNETDEAVSHPVPMNIVLGGRDPVAVDAVEAECMGVPWNEVPYLVKMEQLGLGTANIEKLELLGTQICAVRKVFRRGSVWAFIRTKTETLYGRLLERIGGNK